MVIRELINMPREERENLDIKVLLMVLGIVVSVVAAHFTGIAEAKQYTDNVMREHKEEEAVKVEKILDQVIKLSTQIARIETKLDRR